ncbi:hypothetical protein ALP75_200365 [Pseudomonas syringae pv. actinidiae]|nr:hypothetical protein ALP75_200365 [Pseudomonas syringae pv. actinidiae]
MHSIAIAGQQLFDDTAFEVLHSLAIALHHHDAGAIDRIAQRSKCRPGAKQAEGDQHDRNPDTANATIRSRHVVRVFVERGYCLNAHS